MNTPKQGSPPTFETPTQSEKFLTVDQVAEALGLHAWAIRRAVQRGDVPSYKGFSGRRVLRLSEVIAAINATRKGGAL